MARKRKAPVKYLNEILHYCPECNILFTSCTISVKMEKIFHYDISKSRYKWNYKEVRSQLTEDLLYYSEPNISYYCNECGGNISQYVALVSEYILHRYWNFIHTNPFPVQLDKNKVKDYRYMSEVIESVAFDTLL